MSDKQVLRSTRKRRVVSGREAEGAPLLREYAVKSCIRVRIPASPPFASVAQLDRVLATNRAVGGSNPPGCTIFYVLQR